jgi:hypothetical protein
LNIESFDHFGFIIPSSSPLEMIPLSETEKAYLLNNEQFSKRKQRYLRYRICQKLRRRDAAERGNSSRDAATPRVSLVRIPPQTWRLNRDEREDAINTERWAGSELNQRPPPCQGGILTRLDHRPNIQRKNSLPKYML